MKWIIYVVVFVALLPIAAQLTKWAYNPTRDGSTYPPQDNTQTANERQRKLSHQLKREERNIKRHNKTRAK